MNVEITKQRREKLALTLEPDQIAIVFAKMEQEGIAKFTQDNHFLYFTGLNIPDAIYCMYKINDKTVDSLYIQRGIPEREVWDGKKLTISEAREKTGIESIMFIDEFYYNINGLCSIMNKVWSNIGVPSLTKPQSYAMFMLQPIRNVFPHIKFESINTLVSPIRSVKTDWEISQMQKAIDLTGLGIKKVMQKAKAGMIEYELEAILFYEMQRNGVQNWGFAPIIAAGINATTLHYKLNNCVIAENDVIIMDVGASYQNYSADITRSFPISGKFTPRQKQVYSEVLNIQKEIISMIKPGVSLVLLNEKTNELIQNALIKLELITDPKDFRRYYMHSVGHHLGMDTHDLGARDSVLEVGNVITVEPGIYIPEESLGIRIEDDILVTDTGYVNLSIDIPKEIDDIESMK